MNNLRSRLHRLNNICYVRKIRENSQAPSYRFPENVDISEEAKDLISKLLVNKPGNCFPFHCRASLISDFSCLRL